MSTNRSILFVSHIFPPAGGGGVQRSLKLTKYLTRMGWNITVVTTADQLADVTFGLTDESLLQEVPRETTVIRLPATSLLSREPSVAKLRLIGPAVRRLWLLLAGPDHAYGWSKRAARTCFELGRKTHFDAVLATGGPFSSLMAGARIGHDLGVPFVADFRDGWCRRDWPEGFRPGPRALRWERAVMRRARRVVFATDRLRTLAADAYPHVAQRFVTVENGVDLEEPWWGEPRAVNRERFELVYTGQMPRYCSPRAFFNGLAKARRRSDSFARQTVLVVGGVLGQPEEVARANRAEAERLGLGTVVEERGYLCHADAVRLQRSAGVLVSLIGNGRSAASGKSYEYLAAGRPILALVPSGGEAEKVLGRSSRAVFARPDDVGDIADKLLALHTRWERGELFEASTPEVPRGYTREFQARQFSTLLDQAIAEHRAGKGAVS